MKFKVTAHKESWPYGRPRNPFLTGIDNFPKVITTTRVWEFDAKDESEVRKHWRAAQSQGMANVAGFTLGRIEKVEPQKELAL
jgi:hypothetical protein